MAKDRIYKGVSVEVHFLFSSSQSTLKADTPQHAYGWLGQISSAISRTNLSLFIIPSQSIALPSR